MVQRLRLAVDGVMVVSASKAMVVSTSEALWSRPARPCGLSNGGLGNGGLGQQDVKKTPLVIGTMLGITWFLNGSSSFNEAARMSGTDSIQRWQKMWRPKGCYNLSWRVVASSGQLRPALACCGQLWLAMARCGWLWLATSGYGWPRLPMAACGQLQLVAAGCILL